MSASDADAAAADSRPPISWRELEDVFKPPLKPLEAFLTDVTLEPPSPLPRPPLIFVERRVFADLLRDCRADQTREHGGILLGEIYEDPGGRHFLIVRASILAQHTVGSSVHLQFSSESWQYLWKQMEAFADCVILGWYHTHPNLGVFLSGTDRRTHSLYFSQPWQIAVVIDPVKDHVGFFYGKDGTRTTDTRIFSARTPLLAHSQSIEQTHPASPPQLRGSADPEG